MVFGQYHWFDASGDAAIEIRFEIFIKQVIKKLRNGIFTGLIGRHMISNHVNFFSLLVCL